jgi:hypothetical protein
MAKKDEVERTLIGDYFYPKHSDTENASRRYAGTRLSFSPQELDAAVKAGVVHADEKMDAGVKVNPAGGPTSVESQPPSGPSPDNKLAAGEARKKSGSRYSGGAGGADRAQKPRRVRGRSK